MSDLVGCRIGPYEVRDQIGQGGMATVYRAFQTSLNRYVAIKVLPSWMAQDSQFVQRFRQEALAAGGLRHPNILSILDAGTHEGNHYIVMDYVPGGTLADRMRRGAVPADIASELVAQLADALDYAHRRGIVHRDIKPTNILIDEDGRPLLADFGIAQAMGTGPRLTQSGASVGTPEYMSPEQGQGLRVDGRSDIYSLGIVLYQMLTGRVPFQSATPVATLYQIVYEPPTPPRLLNPNIPQYLENIVLRALAKQPEQRFASGKEMAEALRGHHMVSPPPAGQPEGGETQFMGAPAPAATHGWTPSPTSGLPYPSSQQPAPRAAESRASVERARKAQPKRKANAAPMSAGRGILIGAIVTVMVALVGLGIYLAVGAGKQSTATQTGVAATTPAAEGAAQMSTSSVPSVGKETPMATLTERPASPTPPPATPAPASAAPTVSAASPTATPQPADTPRPTPTTQPTAARPAATVAPLAAVPTTKPGVVLDFETFGTWKRGDEPYGSFAQASDRKHDGNAAAKLTYEIPSVDKHYVVFMRVPPADISGQPSALTLWVYGDGSNHFLNAWIQDSQGEVRQFSFGQVSHSGSWQPMAAQLDPKAAWPQAHISGPDNGQIDYPISLNGFVLDVAPRSGVTTYSGAIYLDDLSTGAVAAPVPSPQSPVSGPATPAAPAPGGSLGGRIVYAIADGATTAIEVLNVASRSSSRLFSNARQGDIRGDDRVVFNGTGGGKNNIFSINVDGSREIMNGMHPEDSYPHWAPSGGSIVFYSTIGDGRERIYIQWDMNVAQEPKVLTTRGTDVYGRAPTWLQDGRIAFSGCNYWASGSNCGIWVVNSDGGGEPQQLTDRPDDRSTDSANGILLFSSIATGNWDIYAIPVTGGSARNLTNSASQDAGATFSPDGSRIAFMSNRDGGWGIWVMNADGQNPQKLFAVPVGFGAGWAEERLAWGP